MQEGRAPLASVYKTIDEMYLQVWNVCLTFVVEKTNKVQTF